MTEDKPGRRVFSFNGKPTAEATSEHEEMDRYTALTLYRERNGYLLHIVGGTPHPDEDERHRYVRCKDPQEVVDALRRTDKRKKRSHSKVALELLRLARRNDERFRWDWEGRHGLGETGSSDRTDS